MKAAAWAAFSLCPSQQDLDAFNADAWAKDGLWGTKSSPVLERIYERINQMVHAIVICGVTVVVAQIAKPAASFGSSIE